MKIVLRILAVILGLGFALIGLDQVSFQVFGQARILVSISWLLVEAAFVSYGVSGKAWGSEL